jgi:hypothetical protein
MAASALPRGSGQQQPERWQRDLLFTHEMRVQHFGQRARSFAGATRQLRRRRQPAVNLLVLHLQRRRNLDRLLLHGSLLGPVSPGLRTAVLPPSSRMPQPRSGRPATRMRARSRLDPAGGR